MSALLTPQVLRQLLDASITGWQRQIWHHRAQAADLRAQADRHEEYIDSLLNKIAEAREEMDTMREDGQ